MDVTVLVASTVVGMLAVGVALGSFDGAARTRRRSRPAATRGGAPFAAPATGVLVVVLSGWLVPALVAGAAVWWAMRAREDGGRGAGRDIQRIEALASWIENLRDVLVAGEQIVGAIAATVPTCPPAIRAAVRRLASGLGGHDPGVVLRRFADDLDDPVGDLVAAGLLIAVRRGARTVAVLSTLADQARHQADRRRLVEAERAPTRREVAALSSIMTALVVALLALGRSGYLRAYDETAGQLFLALAIGIYAALVVRVHRLARFPRPARFLSLDRAA